MCGLLKPDELLASRRLERIEIFFRDFARHDVILPALEKIDRRLESRCRLEKINRKELAPEVFERKFRASNDFPSPRSSECTTTKLSSSAEFT